MLAITISVCGLSALSQKPGRKVPDIWKTKAEKTDYSESPSYEETLKFSRRLDAESDQIVLLSAGNSTEGRDIPLLIAAEREGVTPKRARATGKAVVLIQAAIHAGEPDGNDAGLALFRDIALKRTPPSLLEHLVILFIPILNVDGHRLESRYNRINQNGPMVTGFRANSANLNLNRDYLKADTEEIRSWLRLWNKWDPDFFIDCHVTDGADFRYNITYEYAHHDEIHPGLRAWMRNRFEKSVVPRVERKGNLLSRYIQMIDRTRPEAGIASFIATPRFATGYTPLRNRNGLLIEAHSVKPFKSRVLGTYDLLVETLAEVGNSRSSLLAANSQADQDWLTGNREVFVLSQRIKRESTPFLFKGYKLQLTDSPVSGSKQISYTREPLDVTVPQYDLAEPRESVTPPAYYVVPPQWREIIERLDSHGISYHRAREAFSLEAESYRLSEPVWRRRSFEGRITVSAKQSPSTGVRVFTAGSVIVPVRQKSGQVAIHLLEPKAPDSAFFWGFFNAIFEQKEYSESYVMDTIAKEMLEADAKLKAEFENRLKDPEFASSPRARLRFFYERSRFYDRRIGLYPVARVVGEASVKKLRELISGESPGR